MKPLLRFLAVVFFLTFLWYLMWNRVEYLFYISLPDLEPFVFGIIQALWGAGSFMLYAYLIARIIHDQRITKFDIIFIGVSIIIIAILYTVL